MSKLHTFGCSITQGYALPDVINPILGSDGKPLTPEQIEQQGIQVDFNKIHVLAPSKYAWPQQLADQLGVDVINHARRGACYQQIARQCVMAVKDIQPDDVVMVMWTYMSRLSLQWPARTSVPFANQVETMWSWKSVILGMNKLMGLTPAENSNEDTDQYIQSYIKEATNHTYLNPLGVYNRYYNSMVLQQITDGFLRSTGAGVIHLSVEPESNPQQLEQARRDLIPSLQDHREIPHHKEWYHIKVDHDSCRVILDPSIPPAENDMHPSVTHHRNFAEHIRKKYF